MDFRTLSLFTHLAHTLHFANTANQMAVSPSTLSRTMQRLEQETGCALFERDNRSVVLTNEGKRLLGFAERWLQEWQDLRDDLRHPREALQGRIRVFCSVTASYFLLPEVLGRFRHRYPQLELKLETGDAALAVDKVLQEETDIAIAARPDALPARLQYCLLQHHLGLTPDFTHEQQRWTQQAAEFALAQEIVRHWQRRVASTPHAGEQLFLTLLFMLLKTPDPIRDSDRQDRRLHLAIDRLIHRFQDLAGRPFSDDQGLSDQLYIHLSQALIRSVFAIGIDSTLTEEVTRLYPRLLRTTQAALSEFEEAWHIRFNEEETGLIAVIFGAWLMQKSDLHEKQVLLLTDDNPAIEEALEQQLRELTLLPLNIKYQSVERFQKEGAPKGVTLIVTPYATALPLFSPPLIHAENYFTERQQQHICAMLED